MKIDQFKEFLNLHKEELQETEFNYLTNLNTKEEMLRGLDTLKSCSENPIFNTFIDILEKESMEDPSKLFELELINGEVYMSINITLMKTRTFETGLLRSLKLADEGHLEDSQRTLQASIYLLSANIKFKGFY